MYIYYDIRTDSLFTNPFELNMPNWIYIGEL